MKGNIQVDSQTQNNQSAPLVSPQEDLVVSEGVQELSDQTSTNVLQAIYRDQSILRGVLDILWGKRKNPSDLVEGLKAGRQEFKKLQDQRQLVIDEDSLKDAL